MEVKTNDSSQNIRKGRTLMKTYKRPIAFMLILMLVITFIPIQSSLALGTGITVGDSGVVNSSSSALSLTDGSIWIDKSVSVVNASTGIFDITLKAVGQNYKLKPTENPNPLDVVLVLDTSTSMNGTKLDNMRKAASSAAIQILGITGNRLAVVSYNNTAQVVTLGAVRGFTTSSSVATSAIMGLTQTKNDTNIQHAFYTAHKLFNDQGKANQHKVIILMTDGVPNKYYTVADLSSHSDGDMKQSANYPDTDSNTIWWTLQQAMNTKTNGTPNDLTDDIDIYTVGFEVSGNEAAAVLAPTTTNTAAYVPTLYSGEKRTLTAANTSGSTAQFYRKSNNSTSWSPTSLTTPSNIGSNYVPYSISSSAVWSSAFSNVTTVPQDSLTITKNTTSDTGTNYKTWGNGQNAYKAYVFNALFAGTQYRTTSSEQPTYLYCIKNTNADINTIVKVFTDLANKLTTYAPTQIVTSGAVTYEPIKIQDVIGDGFKVISSLPSDVTSNGAILTWTIPGGSLKTTAAGNLTFPTAADAFNTVTIRVQITDAAGAGTWYTNSRTLGDNKAMFKVEAKNPAYKGVINQTQNLGNYGWLKLDAPDVHATVNITKTVTAPTAI